MELLALALAPGIAIMWFIYTRDRYDRAPVHALLRSFFRGMLAVLPTVIVQLCLAWLLNQFVFRHGWLFYILLSFFVVALTEEFAKFAMVRWYAYPQDFFNEPFDGIIYGVIVAMGFATLENIGYVLRHGMDAALLRMFLSVPAHGAFGVLMGYYIGLAKFVHDKHSRWLMIRAVLLAIFFHGLFDLFLFARTDEHITKNVSSGFLFGSALLSYLVALKLAWQAIRMHQALSKKKFNPNNNTV